MFSDLIQKRRSHRKFTDRKVEKEKIDALVTAALLAPSSRGLDPVRFVVVTEEKLLGQLSAAKPHGASFLKNAPLGIVVCADPSVSDVWVEDASIASIYLHLAAESLGLGSCWIQIRKRMYDDTLTAEKKVAEILGLGERMRVEAVVGIGYSAESKKPRSIEGLDRSRVSYRTD